MTFLRVHVCPVAYEVDRIVLPLLRLKADKAILVTKRVEREKDKARGVIQVITERLDLEGIPYQILECDLLDFYDCLRIVGRDVKEEREQGNHVFVNISSGGRILSHASAVAGMMWGARLYYAAPEEDMRESKEFTKGLLEVVDIPPFQIDPPSETALDCLEILSTKGGSILKRVLIDELVARERLPSTSENRQTLYSAVRRILSPLERKGWIIETGMTRARIVELTSEGERILSGFRGVVVQQMRGG